LPATSSLIFRKGLDLKHAVAGMLAESYHSDLIEQIKAADFMYRSGRLTVHLAREFGFCYGVDRAVDYAYQTRRQFPDKRVYLSGEINHNPDVNRRIQDMGIMILEDNHDPVQRFAPVLAGDVVIMPAFGVSIPELQQLQSKQCILVDTTCGSVLNVWKKVHYYARDRYTVIIHGKHYHEETRATASQALTHDGGQYLCVRDIAETELVCDFIRGRLSSTQLMSHFKDAASSGFDPDRDLQRIGLANQTTMLMSETLKVQETLRRAMVERHGEQDLESRFRAFDTICSATQERQDAVLEMLDAGGLDTMVVIGGYNSSNTQALARMCAPRVQTYYIDNPDCVNAAGIRYRAIGAREETLAPGWLPAGAVRIGITAGASTPDSVVGETIERILGLRGKTAADLTPGANIEQGSSTAATASTFAESVDKSADKQSYA
jgi:4-hydroxy-3-methylbut-2-enyl diphosphate reductase